MEIRQKISLQFTLIVAVIQVLFSLAIYISFAESRVEELYDRLEDKATSVGQMLIDIEEIDIGVLKKIEQNNPLSLPDEKVLVYGRRNQVLFTNDDKGELSFSIDQIEHVRQSNRVRYRIGDFEVLGKLYTSGNNRVVVFVAAIDLYGFKKLKILRLILILVFFVGLAIVYLAGRVFAGRAMQPILKVMEQVDNIGASTLSRRLDEGAGKDEIARLSATFNQLLDRLESSFKMQKTFIANASHELNTPLTVITGQLEVVLMKARTNQEYAETIQQVLSEIKNLNLLSKKLLLLAQASSDLSGLNFVPVRIDTLLWEVRTEMLSRDPGYQINIDLNPELDDETALTIRGNELLLKAAFSNIAENGCKYSNDHTVVILLENSRENLIIHIKDNGIGISETELQMIFQPFYRSKSVKPTEGHGIGLPLARRVITIHGGNLEVISKPQVGSDFIIRLPYRNGNS
jgi:signal transduction histidine kinase